MTLPSMNVCFPKSIHESYQYGITKKKKFLKNDLANSKQQKKKTTKIFIRIIFIRHHQVIT